MTSITGMARRYALLLGETRRIYAAAAEACVGAAKSPSPPERFREEMELLRQGLVIKTYVTIARADQRWSRREPQLAQILVEHLWNRSLSGEALRDAARRLFSDADRLVWDELIRPFRRWKPLREYVSAIETAVLRMAHLIAESAGPPDRLGRIFESLAAAQQYELTPEVRARLLQGFSWIYARRDEHFGNGRHARNVLERAIRQMANRVVDESQPTREMLVRFEASDFPFDEVPQDIFMSPEELRVVVACPECASSMEVRGTQLEGDAPCPRCSRRFDTRWGRIEETPRS